MFTYTMILNLIKKLILYIIYIISIWWSYQVYYCIYIGLTTDELI